MELISLVQEVVCGKLLTEICDTKPEDVDQKC